MSGTERRLIRFAGGAVAVETLGAAAETIVEFLCGNMPGSPAEEGPPPAVLRLEHNSGDGRFHLFRDSQMLAGGRNSGWLAEQTLGQICTCLADGAGAAMVFHAAALAWQGVAVLIPGRSGAGKSTLAFWLARQGWGYLTDELAAVPAGRAVVDGLRRPLGLKQAALPVVAPWLESAADPGGVLRIPHGAMVAPRLLPVPPAGPAPLGRIVFPAYRPGAGFELEPLTPARTVALLMGCLLNARNLPGDGLAAVAGLARRVPAFRLRYGCFDQLGPAGQRLHDPA